MAPSTHAIACLLLAALLTAAAACAEEAQAPTMAPELAAASMLIGNGQPCFSDAGCGPPGARGACVLATCFGLLTSDSTAARAALADRLGRATPAVKKMAGLLLLKAIRDPQSGRSTRLGAVEGLGRLQVPDAPCDEGCGELRGSLEDDDEAVAIAARLMLARRRDPAVRAPLIADLQQGTEHLRCAAARALAHYVGHEGDADVVGALVALLGDPGPVVRKAALSSLRPAATRPAVAAALARSVAGRP